MRQVASFVLAIKTLRQHYILGLDKCTEGHGMRKSKVLYLIL